MPLPEDVRQRARDAAIAKDDEDPTSPDGWIASVDAAAAVAYEAGLAARAVRDDSPRRPVGREDDIG